MVGGLVEQEHVRLLREDDAEAQPSPLAARQGRDGALEVAAREAEVARERRDLVLQLVAAGEVVALGDVREALERGRLARCRAVLGAVELVAQLDHLAKAGHERAEDVALRGDLVRLPVVPERRLAPEDDRAAVGLELLRDDAQERRLAGAVRRDEGDAIPDRERERDVLEERIAGVPEAQVGHLENGHSARLRD